MSSETAPARQTEAGPYPKVSPHFKTPFLYTDYPTSDSINGVNRAFELDRLVIHRTFEPSVRQCRACQGLRSAFAG